MGVYFGETEITGMHFGEQEITEIFFGNAEIFTVWAEYDGTLPAQYSANGDYLANYRIYGSVGGVGDKTINLWGGAFSSTNKYLMSDGSENSAGGWGISAAVEIEPETTYVLSNIRGYTPALCFYDEQMEYLSGAQYSISVQTPTGIKTVISPVNAKYLKFSVIIDEKNVAMLTPGSTAPTSYIPYGYEALMNVRSANLCPNTTILSSGYSVTITSNDLFDTFKNIKANVVYQLSWLYESNGTGGVTDQIRLYDANGVAIKILNNGGTFSLTAEEITAFITISAYFGSTNTNGKMSNFMFAEGPTPLPYQPYSKTVTPIYIGSDPLEAIGDYTDFVDYGVQKIIRKIIKIEFTGEENWRTYGELYYVNVLNFLSSAWGTTAGFSRCSHFTPSLQPEENGEYAMGGLTRYHNSRWNGNVLFNTGTSLEDFKPYLATQKAAGTPVTLWYVCEIPIEESPPVPLPALPTVDGTNIVDYAGQSMAPSRFYAKYRKEGF